MSYICTQFTVIPSQNDNEKEEKDRCIKMFITLLRIKVKNWKQSKF